MTQQMKQSRNNRDQVQDQQNDYVHYNQNHEQFYIKQKLKRRMLIGESGHASSFFLRRSFMNAHSSPCSHSPSQKSGDDLYLNMKMPAIFTPSEENSLKTFNRKLQQSLKKREMQQIVQIHNNHMLNHIPKAQLSPKTKTRFSEKILIIDEQDVNQTKSLFSITRNKDAKKKFSLNMKYESPERKNIFHIPPIKEDLFEEHNIFQNLITSESSKGLIERLLKRKKVAKQEQEKQECKFRYPLNRKYYNRVSKKSRNIKGSKLLITFEQRNAQAKQTSPQKPFKQLSYQRITRYNNKNLILSHSKRKPWSEYVKSQPHNTVKNITCPQADGEEIGPWRQQGGPSFDI